MTDSVKRKLSEFIRSELLLENNKNLTEDEALFSSNIIDSMNLIQLIIFIEEKFNIKVQPTEMTLDNFNSIEKISSYIDKKMHEC